MAEQTKRQQLEMHLAGRALQDPDFRARLLGAPKRTIEDEIGLHFPDTLNVRVHEEKLNELHVVLPVELQTLGELSPNLIHSSQPQSSPFWGSGSVSKKTDPLPVSATRLSAARGPRLACPEASPLRPKDSSRSDESGVAVSGAFSTKLSHCPFWKRLSVFARNRS